MRFTLQMSSIEAGKCSNKSICEETAFFRCYAKPESQPAFIDEAGIERMFEDCGISPYSLAAFAFVWKIEAQTMGIITFAEWSIHCLHIDSVSKLLQFMLDVFALLQCPIMFEQCFTFVFDFAKDPQQPPELQRQMSVSLALEIFKVFFERPEVCIDVTAEDAANRYAETTQQIANLVAEAYPLNGAFMAFVEKHATRIEGITRDQWRNILPFLRTFASVSHVKTQWDAATSAWPVLFDDFIAWLICDGALA